MKLKLLLLAMSAKIDMAVLEKENEIKGDENYSTRYDMRQIRTKAELFRKKIVHVKEDPANMDKIIARFREEKRTLLMRLSNIHRIH